MCGKEAAYRACRRTELFCLVSLPSCYCCCYGKLFVNLEFLAALCTIRVAHTERSCFIGQKESFLQQQPTVTHRLGYTTQASENYRESTGLLADGMRKPRFGS